MWVERVLLKDHGDVAFGWGEMIDYRTVDAHLACCLAIEPGDDAQERRFAATGGAEQNREAPIRNLQ